MRKLLIAIALIQTCSAIASSNDEMGRLAKMSETLQKRSIEEFMATARANRWEAPRIPSKWFVDTKVTDDEEKRLSQAARDFGYQLALRLEVVAQEQQAFPPNEALFQRTLLLCDLGEWCAKSVGYGNFLLAWRCLNIATVGLARLTASMDIPLGKCEELATRMTPKWHGIPYVIQVLNHEANTNIFINASMTYDQLVLQWGVGYGMRRAAEEPALIEKRGPPPLPDAKLVNVGAFTNNLYLFVDVELPQRPATLSRSWDCRQHQGLINLAEGMWGLTRAQSLLEYRSVVGFFPPPFVRSEKATRQLEAEIIEAAKWGRKMTKMEDSPSYNPLKEAFRREWDKRVSNVEDKNKYAAAFYAYEDVTNNAFYDEDTAKLQTEKQREQMKAQRQSQTE